MAQHRTKEDKEHAQIQRMQKAKTYSLQDLGLSTSQTTFKKSGKETDLTFGVEMKHVQTDLLRTIVSTVIILVLLGAGVYFLR